MDEYKTLYEAEAVNLVDSERQLWQDAIAWVTPRIGFNMRNVIERARNNYYGVFTDPKDTATGVDKIWYPVTEWTTEAVVKNVDMDTRDIRVSPVGKNDLGIARLARYTLQWFFRKVDFGQTLNDVIRSMCIDGTAVVKVWRDKKEIRTAQVDLQNFYIDPSAPSIQEASSVIERSIMMIDEFKRYKGIWENVDKVDGSESISRTDDVSGTTETKVPYVDVWERWGKMRKALITKDPADYDIWVDGKICCAGLGSSSNGHVFLYAEENKTIDKATGKVLKPYEEVWYTRVPSRWHGRGVSEKLFAIQENLNEIINIRANNARILQNGLFEVRRGSGITKDNLSRLGAGGAIPVTALGVDIKQMNIQDYRQSSYADQTQMLLAAERVTLSPAISQGAPSPASMPATNASIQDKNSKDAFGLIQEGIGFLMKRLVSRHYLPLLSSTLTKNDYVNITDSINEIQIIDDKLLDYSVKKSLIEYYNTYGILPSDEEILQATTEARTKMSQMGNRIPTKMDKDLFDTEFDIDIDPTDESLNRGAVVQQLREMLIAYSRMPQSNLNTDAVMEEILDSLGMDGRKYFNKVNPNPPVAPPSNVDVGRSLAGEGMSGSSSPMGADMNSMLTQGVNQ
jgi:hypothetical protein